ncbi:MULTISPECIES: cation transporter [unclassified Pseudomonas]|uniref:heavy-metal-associated domain-containing protein n=1 Tax=unclassified Pseudomonas TaxID=196821 RepID=UPI002AC9E7FD|nr:MULTISPECIES: cation transporter [unclassified Pseudomonas]MEB0043219.1 cation transporter [Pseudomonas sp. MH10]MEB0080115.1 cation transporter [Pseudomonas sp. MH10out]MEB0094088.1 cation transporter [Pseudomonas sp. CCI4.2]MEB0104444.1 cation transporter [Pseudomonas sp. CCI3.2]MEB0123428.1 cation transporter [Pseudomonas sp. CCI1.2]
MQRFNVQGMTCGHCVRAITQAVHRDDPAADVKVDLATGLVQVESTLAADALIGLISGEGYVVTPQAV